MSQLTDEQIDEMASEHNVYVGKFDAHSTAILCDIKDIRNLVHAALALSPADPLSHQSESESGAVPRPTLGDRE